MRSKLPILTILAAVIIFTLFLPFVQSSQFTEAAEKATSLEQQFRGGFQNSESESSELFADPAEPPQQSLTCPDGSPLRQLYEPTFNGCGPEFAEKLIPDQVMHNSLYPCCDDHDVCYGTIGQTQSMCDEIFRACLQKGCYDLFGPSGWRANSCLKGAFAMHKAVTVVGRGAFRTAQLESGCLHPGDQIVEEVNPMAALERMRAKRAQNEWEASQLRVVDAGEPLPYSRRRRYY